MRPRRVAIGLIASVLALSAAESPARAEEPQRTEAEPRDTPGPAQALAASAAYPGLGQLLNGAESKAAVVGGAEAFLIARLVLEDRRTRHSLRLYNETGEGRYFNDYSEHFDRRQTLVWWVVVAALFGIADAYVDAHLDGFDAPMPAVLDGLSAGPGDGASGEGLRLGVALRF